MLSKFFSQTHRDFTISRKKHNKDNSTKFNINSKEEDDDDKESIIIRRESILQNNNNIHIKSEQNKESTITRKESFMNNLRKGSVVDTFRKNSIINTFKKDNNESSVKIDAKKEFKESYIKKESSKNVFSFDGKEGKDVSYDFMPLSIKNGIIKNKHINSSITSGEFNENAIKIIKKINSLVIEIIILFIMVILSIIMIIIFSNKNEINKLNLEQQLDGKWYYQCILEKSDVIYSCLEYFLVFIILIKGNCIQEYERVFVLSRFITISTKFGIAFGPLID
ncbi:hypothetical protein PIROE2DRAFT_11178, partial [Piromyces sp. E2]